MRILATTPDRAAALAEGKPISRGNGGQGVATGPAIGLVQIIGEIFQPKVREWIDQLRRQAADDSVVEVIAVIDSPGGSFRDSSLLAEEIRDLAAVKPVHVFVDGYCCSGGLYAASQATTVTASRQSIIGSIGTIMVLTDSERMFERMGLKVIPIATGRFKQTGVPGVKVTAEEIDQVRQLANTINEMFLADLAKGRKLNVKYVRDELADGSVWSAVQARERGLVDRVETLKEFLARAQIRMDVLLGPNHQQKDEPTGFVYKRLYPADYAPLGQ